MEQLKWIMSRKSRSRTCKPLESKQILSLALAIFTWIPATSATATPADGVYSGTTSQGRPISITVTGGDISGYSFGWSCSGSSGTYNSSGTCPVGAGDSFSCGNPSCSFVPFSVRAAISGAFTGDSVTGTLDFSFFPCTFGCSCCVVNGVTFTASLPSPTISINDITITEGDSGTTTAQFEIRRSHDDGHIVTVDWQTADGSADATDYAPAAGTVSFGSGELARNISISVFGDLDEETDEHFFVDLSNPRNADLADDQGRCTITDDDSPTPVPMTIVLGVGALDSIDGLDDPDNVILVQSLGPGTIVTGIGWDLDLETVGSSLLSNARLYFDGSDQDGLGLFLTPGVGDNFSGTGSYASPIVDLSDNGIPDIPILDDGNLYIQLFESFDHAPGEADAHYLAPSSLTIEFLPSDTFIFVDGFETGDLVPWGASFP